MVFGLLNVIFLFKITLEMVILRKVTFKDLEFYYWFNDIGFVKNYHFIFVVFFIILKIFEVVNTIITLYRCPNDKFLLVFN